MATAVAPSVTTRSAAQAAPARARTLSSRGITALVFACVVIFALTLALSTTIPAPLAARIGLSLFLTFWLGGGFGLIAAGSAIADHLH